LVRCTFVKPSLTLSILTGYVEFNDSSIELNDSSIEFRVQ